MAKWGYSDNGNSSILQWVIYGVACLAITRWRSLPSGACRPDKSWHAME